MSGAQRRLEATRRGRPGSQVAVPPTGRPGLPWALVLDLVAAALTAGTPPDLALHAVAGVLRAAGDDLGSERLRQVSAELVVQDSRSASVSDPDHARLLAALRLAARAGLPPSLLVRRAARESRRRAVVARRIALRRVEVLLVLPLGLCLLPSFVLLAVAPLVIALFTGG